MKAISLWQPWASAVAVGSKTMETRHWATKYRGQIVIHAAKRRVIDELIGFNSSWNWVGALKPIGASFGNSGNFHDILPFGALVAVADLVDCRPTEDVRLGEIDVKRYQADDPGQLYGWTERQMGNFDLQRFAWTLENVLPLTDPIPYKGGQGFFNVPDELIAPVIEKNLGAYA